jgi:hypothetical protein
VEVQHRLHLVAERAHVVLVQRHRRERQLLLEEEQRWRSVSGSRGLDVGIFGRNNLSIQQTKI